MDKQLEESRLVLAGPEVPELPTEQLRRQIGEDRAALAAFFTAVEADMTELFTNLRAKAGTVEFPNRQLARKQLDKAYRRELAPFEKMARDKQYVFFALAEHWRLKLRNRKLIFGVQFGVAESCRNIEQETHTQLEPAFRELHEGLQSFAAKLSAPDERIKKDAYELKDWVEARVSALINRLVVITSYSIHYTKLYEEDNQEKLRHMSTGFSSQQWQSISLRLICQPKQEQDENFIIVGL